MSHRFDPDWIVLPGEILADHMAECELSAADVGRICGVDPTVVDGIIGGDPISEQSAASLAELGHVRPLLAHPRNPLPRRPRSRENPAAVRFLSLEPLLGPLPSLDLTGIDWVIVGAESGPGARPMNLDWVRDIRDRCVAAGIPFFFKQKATGAGRKIPLPELDGRTWTETPGR